NGQGLKNPPPCWRFDPSVEGRYRLFKASMDELLNPVKRGRKVTNFNREVVIRLLPKLSEGDSPRFFNKTIVFPAGIPSSRIGNFQHKEYVLDLVGLKKGKETELKRKLIARHGSDRGEKVFMALQERLHDFFDPEQPEITVKESLLLEAYSNSPELRENDGHLFGEDLSDKDKKALTAFLATL
ncbi:MAG: cytochrome c, partial [Nitrospiraceae bacterium]|nr:cytochrome c [Nitrospiraceae bacterium]